MSHSQDQRDELEALSEIYYNAIKVISDEVPITFSINIKLQSTDYQYLTSDVTEDTDDDDEGSDDSEYEEDDDSDDEVSTSQNSRSINILFKLPPEYPQTVPEMRVIETCNLDDDEVAYIRDKLRRKAKESLGSVMVFTLVTDVMEWLSTKSQDEAVELELEKERQRDLGREECKQFDGTPVTEQTFLAWKAKFDAELLKARIAQQKLFDEQGSLNTNRLTGREMFETDKTLAESDLNFVEDLDQGELEALMQNLDSNENDDQDSENYISEVELEESGEDEKHG